MEIRHDHTGFVGSQRGLACSATTQAAEDAYVLGCLLGAVEKTANVQAAFRAFDKVRPTRSQKVSQRSREAGELITLRLSNVLEDPKP